MKRKHTEGPWTVQWPDYDGKQFKIYKVYETGAKMLIASLPQRNGCMCYEDRANVLLLQAAPKMYELLAMWLEEAIKSCTANYKRWRDYGLHRESWLESPGTIKMFERIRETKKLLKSIGGEGCES